MISELIQAFLFIFIAEMGDKTQILAMAFATKYSLSKVLLGVMLGSALNHGLAAVLGTYLTLFIPIETIQLIAAFAFIGFGLWSLKIGDEDEEENNIPKFGPVLMVASAFFIGEMGDKTQLTVIALSSTAAFPFFVVVGTVLGMIFTSAIGIFVGSRLGKKIPETTIKIVAACIFLTFGIMGLLENVPVRFATTTNIVFFLMVLASFVAYLIRKMFMNIADTPHKRAAQNLYLNTQKLQNALDKVSFEQEDCQKCNENNCTIKCLKKHLAIAQDEGAFITQNRWDVPFCESAVCNRQSLKECLMETINTCLQCPNHQDNCVGSQTREVLEKMYFGKTIPFDGNIQEYREEIEKIEPDFFK